LAFGLCVDLQRPWSEIRLIGEAADSAGWHSIYLPDHFMPHETRNRAAGGSGSGVVELLDRAGDG